MAIQKIPNTTKMCVEIDYSDESREEFPNIPLFNYVVYDYRHGEFALVKINGKKSFDNPVYYTHFELEEEGLYTFGEGLTSWADLPVEVRSAIKEIEESAAYN